MDELRLVGADDHTAVVIRAEAPTPRRDVAALLQQTFATTDIPVLGDTPLTGILPFGTIDAKEGATIGWVPAGSLSNDVGFAIVCTAGDDLGRRWPIAGTELFIGRDAECHIALGDQSVSRRHTRLSVESTRVVIEDLGSTNGTQLNDRRLGDPEAVADGDRIRIGNTMLAVVAVSQNVQQPSSPPPTPLRLCVIGGPAAGQSFPINASIFAVGQGPGVPITVDDPTLSQHHFQVETRPDSIVIQDLGSHNGTTVNGFAITEPSVIALDSIIRAGDNLYAVRAASVADAVLGPVEAGRHRYDRAARIRSYPPTPDIAVPLEPSPQEKPKFPWPIIIAPIAISLVMAFVFKRPEALLFSMLTPVMAISTNMSAKKSIGRKTEAAAAEYNTAVSAMYAAVHRTAAAQTTQRWHAAPDPCQVADTALGPDSRLWERRLNDSDTLVARLGTAPTPADIKLTGRNDVPTPDLPYVPVLLDIEVAGVTSLAGAPQQVRPLARWILGQLITLVSPADLSIGVLTHAASADDWGWLGWAPHGRLVEGRGIRLGNDTQTIETRVSALTAHLEDRQQQRDEHRIDVFSPLILTVIDNSRDFRRTPGVLRLLEEGPSVGLLFLTLDADTNRTPGEAGALLAFDQSHPTHCRLQVSGHQPIDAILGEGVTAKWLFDVARSIAPIQPASDDAAAQIPGLVRFADLAEIDVEDDGALFASWAAGARTNRAIVGATAEGAFSVDIAQDGPHAFLAGTTGSGKTELLLTFITALALGNRPEALNIIVVDWKGGGDFVELGGLPHTVGMVTNLDGHLAKRALASLQAEVARRQNTLKELKEAGKISESNIGSVWDEAPELARQTSMSRLVIVVDEFAELAQSLPEFLAGLVRIARVGRALGIHLMLATQRPRGVITGDLSANVGLRLVLRTESGESREVLESDHADHISRRTRGRGFVRYGDPPRLVEFQTARVAGRRPGAVVGLRPPLVDLVAWKDLGYALPSPPQRDDAPDADSTDLRALVDMTQRVSASMNLAPPRSPWLPPLPAHVDLADLAVPAGGLAAPFGVLDEPSAQQQRPIVFDLANDGHLAVAGSSGSGRTTVLRTLAASLAKNVSAADCNIYGFDFGNGGLLSLSDLPHVGAIVRSSEPDRVARVLERLAGEIGKRQQILAKVQAANIGDQRALDPDNALPYIVVLVDRWDSFNSQYPLDTSAHQIIVRLARDGLGVGIHLAMTGDRYLLGGRMSGEFERKLMLPFADRDDYRDGNLRPQDLPEVIAPGRAFVTESGDEVQIAALGLEDSGPALRDSIRAIIDAATAQGFDQGADNLIRVEALPTEVAFAQVWKRTKLDQVTSPLTGLLAVGGDDLAPELVDLSDIGPGFTIAGPPGTGRSTALVALVRSAIAFGSQVIAITPRSSPISSIVSESLHFAAVGELDADDLLTRCSAAPTLLVIDDVHLLNADDGALLRGLVDQFPNGGSMAFAIAGDIDKLSLLPLAMASRRSGSGLLLSPKNLDRDLLSLSGLPATIIGRQPPGRGFLARRSNGHEVHVLS